ncbi:MAG: MBL fold metallo-hydrolase [Acidobacteria bacterium]|nr:MBL fold metallo-hydrolase [Acidobacteriota bacterium]
MIFTQFYLKCLAHASYLIGDEQTRTAAVVDPRRDVDPYIEEAERHGLQIRHVFLTHFHADFIAGHLELRDRTGAAIHLGARARSEYPFIPMRDGDAVELGQVRLEVLETPGHTIESISILVYDRAGSGRRPHAVLTGDTLFVGDVGRPDLRAALGWSARELSGLLYESLRTKLVPLPDETRVYPAHGAGSLCGKSLGPETFSTIGAERRSNYSLQPMSQADFITLVTADQPDAPPYFTYDAALNAKDRPTLEASLEHMLHARTLEELEALQRAGGQVLDAREPGDFAQGHVAGSINVGLSGQYATWAGTVLSRERPTLIVADPGREREAATRLGRIGFDNVAGYLTGGMEALASRPDLVRHTERMTVADLAAALASPEPPLVLDVRARAEWIQTRIAGIWTAMRPETGILSSLPRVVSGPHGGPSARSAPRDAGSRPRGPRDIKSGARGLLLPLNQLQDRIADLPRDRTMVVHCAGGYRSSIASSLLQRHGLDRLAELTGGLAAWEAAGLPVEGGERASLA